MAKPTLITSLAVKSDDQGKIAVPAKIFQDLIKTFGDQPLTFSVRRYLSLGKAVF